MVACCTVVGTVLRRSACDLATPTSSQGDGATKAQRYRNIRNKALHISQFSWRCLSIPVVVRSIVCCAGVVWPTIIAADNPMAAKWRELSTPTWQGGGIRNSHHSFTMCADTVRALCPVHGAPASLTLSFIFLPKKLTAPLDHVNRRTVRDSVEKSCCGPHTNCGLYASSSIHPSHIGCARRRHTHTREPVAFHAPVPITSPYLALRGSA